MRTGAACSPRALIQRATRAATALLGRRGGQNVCISINARSVRTYNLGHGGGDQALLEMRAGVVALFRYFDD